MILKDVSGLSEEIYIFEDFEETRFVFFFFHFLSLMVKSMSDILLNQTKSEIFHQMEIEKSEALFCGAVLWKIFN